MAKRSTGARIIRDTSQIARSSGLVDTVAQLASRLISAIAEWPYSPHAHTNAFATGWNKNCRTGCRLRRDAGSAVQPRIGVKAVMANEDRPRCQRLT